MKTSRHTSSFHLRPCHSKPQYAACVTHSVSLEKPSQGPSFAHARTRGSVLERGRPAGNRATPLLVTACVRAKTLQSCLTLCNPMDRILPGSSVHGILRTRILEWAAMPSSRGLSRPWDGTRVSMSPVLAGRLTTSTTWEAPFLTARRTYSLKTHCPCSRQRNDATLLGGDY